MSDESTTAGTPPEPSQSASTGSRVFFIKDVTGFAIALVLQLAMIAAFGLMMAGNQQNVTDNVAGSVVPITGLFDPNAGLTIDPELVAEIPKAFDRFYLSLVLVGVLATIRQIACERLLSESKTRWRLIATGCVMTTALCWAAFTCYLQFPLCGDDSYIDYRYVNNWLKGNFDYNPGERVLGFTSVIHVILLAVVTKATGAVNIDLVSQMINACLQLVDICLIYFLLADVLKSRALGVIGATIFACEPYNSHQVVFGKEPQICLLMLILSMWSIHRKWYHAHAWIACMLPFVRPEGIVWSFLCFVDSLRSMPRKEILKNWAAPLGAAALILIFLFVLFGTVIPHGAIAKSTMFYHVPNLALSNIAWMIGTGAIIPKWFVVFDPAYMIISFIPAVITLVIFWFVAQGKPFRLYSYAVLIYLAIYAVKVNLAFQWYLCWFALVSVITVPLVVQRTWFSKKQVFIRKPFGAILCFYVLLVLITEQGVRNEKGFACVSFPWTAESDRVLQYRKTLDDLREKGEAGPDTTIATPEIGMVGYRHDGKILDLVGLVSPEVIKYGPPPLERRRRMFEFLQVNPDIVKDMKPDYVLVLDAWSENLRRDDFFCQNYEEINFRPNKFWGSTGVFVYKLKKSQPVAGSANRAPGVVDAAGPAETEGSAKQPATQESAKSPG